MKIKKREKINLWLHSYINQNKFSDNNKLPSENMLCQKFKVSRSMIRNILKKLKEEEYVYKVRGSGTYINKNSINIKENSSSSEKIKIGIILQGQDIVANEALISGIDKVFKEKLYLYNIFYTDNKFFNERECLENIMDENFDGFIVDGVKSTIINPNIDCYKKLYSKKKPLIFYNNYYKELKYPKITTDEISSARKLVGKLLEEGHENIAGIFICDNYQSIEKFNGYASALRDKRVLLDDDYIKWCVSDQAHNEAYSKEIKKFLKSLPKCTGIVCCNYLIYILVKKAIKEMGNIKNYSLVCFDYSKENWKEEKITCSIHPGFEIGVRAGENIIKMIQNKEYSGEKYSKIVTPEIHYAIKS